MAKKNSTTGSVVGEGEEKKINDQKKVKKVRKTTLISQGNNGSSQHPWFHGQDE